MSALAISPCKRLIARTTTEGQLEITVLPSVSQSHPVTSVILPIEHHFAREFIPSVHVLKFSLKNNEDIAESNGREAVVNPSEMIETWLLLAGKHRLVAFHIELPLHGSSRSILLETTVDVEFPQLYGKITSAEFVFGHESALVLFEIAPHASILSLNQAQRDDIPNRKFSTDQGYSILDTKISDHDSKPTSSLALLTRDKHSDFVVVLDRGKVVSSFKTETIDACGVKWSPDGCPLLMVWDSPAYGLKVSFTTAFGHPLRLLDISPESRISLGLSTDFHTLGVSILDWVQKAGTRNVTALVFGHSTKSITLRTQDSKSLTVESQTFKYPKMVRGMRTAIWQEIGHNKYEAVLSGINLDVDDTANVDIVAASSDGCKVASKLQDPANMVLIWERRQTDPIAAIVLQNDIQQLLWDDSSALCIVTSENKPSFHYCANFQSTPVRVLAPRLEKYSSSRWRGRWLNIQPISAGGHTTRSQKVFVMSSKSHFDALFLNNVGRSTFSSIFQLESTQAQESILDLQSSTRNSVSDHDQSSLFF